LNILTLSRPRARLKIETIIIAKVVVLIPPTVEAGEPPIHIIIA